MMDSISPMAVRPQVSVIRGEGMVRRLAQGEDAISGVTLHEAGNLINLTAEARRAGEEIIFESVQVKFGIDPKTGRVVVVGGESRVVTRPSHPLQSPHLPPPASSQGAGAADSPAAGASVAGAAQGNEGSTARPSDQSGTRQTEEALARIERSLRDRLAQAESITARDGTPMQPSEAEVARLHAALTEVERQRQQLELQKQVQKAQPAEGSEMAGVSPVARSYAATAPSAGILLNLGA